MANLWSGADPVEATGDNSSSQTGGRIVVNETCTLTGFGFGILAKRHGKAGMLS